MVPWAHRPIAPDSLEAQQVSLGYGGLTNWIDAVVLFFLNHLTSEQFIILGGLFTIFPHFVEIVFYYNFVRGVQWFVKIFTDPFTDILDFYHHWYINPKWFLDLREQRQVQYNLDIFSKRIQEWNLRLNLRRMHYMPNAKGEILGPDAYKKDGKAKKVD